MPVSTVKELEQNHISYYIYIYSSNIHYTQY